MPESLLSIFERFCDDLPETVRHDLSFMMVILSDEDIAVEQLSDVDERVPTLFESRTFIGRMGNLIGAVSIFDVYFALDPGERFGLAQRHGESKGEDSSATRSHIYNRYADRSRAIRAAKQVWTALRRTTLSAEAIAAALVPLNAAPDASSLP